jgi:hypothetical protein
VKTLTGGVTVRAMTSPYDPQQPYPQDVPTAYPQDGYATPGYGQQQPYAPGGYPYPVYVGQQTNTMAILSLVFAFVFAPAAIVLGHIARKQIRQRGDSGDGLALAGLICGYIFTVLYLLFCGLYATLFALAIHGANNDYYDEALRLGQALLPTS